MARDDDKNPVSRIQCHPDLLDVASGVARYGYHEMPNSDAIVVRGGTAFYVKRTKGGVSVKQMEEN